MMIMTAKVDLKKIAVILGSIAAVILALILLFGGGEAQTTSATVSGNEGRVKQIGIAIKCANGYASIRKHRVSNAIPLIVYITVSRSKP